MTGGVDTTVFAAFAAGFVSFVSPCVLPLVPGYLSAVSGVNVTELDRGRRDVLLPALVFCLSFTAVFVALGMAATGLGSTLQDNRELLNRIAGALIVTMGLLFIGMLVAMGVLIFTGEIARLNVEAQRLLESVGLGDLYSV